MPTDLLVLLSPKNIVLFIIVFTRLGGLMTSAPLFSTYPIPPQIKAWLIASITFIIFPFMLAKSGFQMPNSMPELAMILIKEFMVGYIVGFLANLIFIGVEMAADIVSIQMGLSMAQALNPTSGDHSPVLAQAYSFIAALVFLGINAHHQLFSAVYKSFQAVPIGYSLVFSGDLINNIMMMTGQMFTIAISVAMPIFSVLLITDILLGFVAKMMPQMNIFMVAMPLKIYIGLVLVIMMVAPMTEHMVVVIENVLKSIISIF